MFINSLKNDETRNIFIRNVRVTLSSGQTGGEFPPKFFLWKFFLVFKECSVIPPDRLRAAADHRATQSSRQNAERVVGSIRLQTPNTKRLRRWERRSFCFPKRSQLHRNIDLSRLEAQSSLDRTDPACGPSTESELHPLIVRPRRRKQKAGSRKWLLPEAEAGFILTCEEAALRLRRWSSRPPLR